MAASDAKPAAAPAVAATTAGDSHWLPGIEALRALAASAVVLHHMYDLANRPDMPGGTIIEGFGEWGVDIFFILSAFLLCEFFWHDRPRRSLRVFYTRRALRIGPAYYAAVLILFLFFADRTILFSPQGVHQVWANATFTQYLMPGTSSSLNVDGALWTLTIEMLLYLCLPLMAIPFRRHPYLTFVGLCAIGVGWRIWVVQSAQPLQHIAFGDISSAPALANARLYFARQFVGFVPLFAVGMLVRWWVVNRKLPRPILTRVQGSSLGILLLLLVPSVLLLNAIVPASNWQHWAWFIGFDTVLGVLAAGALVYASRPVARTLWLPMRAAVWLGKRSYGLYLWHFPVVLALYERGPMSSPPRLTHFAFRFVLIWVISIGFAAASYRFVEKPAMDWGKVLTRRWQARARAATA